MFGMKKQVVGLILAAITFVLISTVNDSVAVELPSANNNASFLTYNDTAYGISIKYPSNWQIDESADEYLLAVLQNLTSYSQTTNDSQTNAIKSKVSEILNAFGLESVSDVVGLSPDKKGEVFQKISQLVNEGTFQTIVSITSLPEDEFDTTVESMNIVADNISTVSPVSLHDYVNANVEGLKIAFQDLTIVQPAMEITIDGKPAMSLVYTIRHPVDESVTLKSLVVLMINGNTGYVITFGSVLETYSVYAPTFEKMLQSFRITN